MGKSATLALKITGDSSGGVRAIDEVEGRAGKLGAGFGKLAGLAAGAFAVSEVVDFGKQAFDAASNLEQMAGAVDAVFGQSAAQIDALAAKAHDAVGLSTADYDQMASVIGSQLKNAGVPMDQLAAKTDGLIKQGADMSAVFGGSAADAVEALSSVMKGEFDPIEKYGVSLNQTSINAELAARHQDKLTGAALKQAQTQAALDLVTRQTTATQGQFAAQGDTAAEKSQKLGAWFDDLKAKIGGGLLPIFTGLVGFFQTKVGPVLDDLFRKGGPIATLFAQYGQVITGTVLPALSDLWNTLAPKLLPILKDVGGFISSIVIPAFQGIWNIISKYVVPIFKTVLTPILDGVGKVIHTVSEKINEHRGTFENLFHAVEPLLTFLRDKVAPFIGGVFKTAFEVLGKAIGPVIDAISWVADKVEWLLKKGGQFLNWIFGGSSPSAGGANRGAAMFGAPATAGGGGRLFGAGSSLGGGGLGPAAAAQGPPAGDTYNITVNGALDPVAVADQIARMLDARARRTGARVAVAMGTT